MSTFRPQVRLDRDAEGGMSTVVGRLRSVQVMRLLRFCSFAALVVSLAGCASPSLPPPVMLAAPPQARPETLQWAVEAALAEHNWTVVRRGAGFVVAHVHSQGTNEDVTIQVAHRARTIQIDCLRANVSPQRYDRWIHLLTTAINKYAAGAGAPPALAN